MSLRRVLRPTHSEDGNVEVVGTQTAEEFLAYLDRGDRRWGDGPQVRWVFRGHGDDRWRLLPRALREDGRAILQRIYDALHRLPSASGEKWPDARVWLAAEFEALKQFVELADELGFQVPDGEFVPRGAQFLRASSETIFPPSIATALAQHHGIPTRLLDWTRNPLVAAFFAAEDGDRLYRDAIANTDPEDGSGPDGPQYICVWALDTMRLRRFELMSPRRSVELKQFTVPRSVHAYLHAQDGVFIHCDEFATSTGERSLEKVLALDPKSISPPSIRKVTLPVTEARELLGRLYRHRVSRAHLMRTLDNVASVTQLVQSWPGEEWECPYCKRTNSGLRINCAACGVLSMQRAP